MTPTNGNVLWDVLWADGRHEIVEARNLQQDGGMFGFFGESAKERWVLYAEGRGVVLVADKDLITSIRCLNPAGEPINGSS